MEQVDAALLLGRGLYYNGRRLEEFAVGRSLRISGVQKDI